MVSAAVSSHNLHAEKGGAAVAVTLKDVAAALGVTTTTVHKALAGKPGVSPATRDKVRRTARAMGYQPNVMAASLKRQPLRFALVLPRPVDEGRYYYGSLWRGARRFFETVEGFEATALEMPYPSAPGAAGQALAALAAEKPDGLDGVLTLAAEDSQARQAVAALHAAGVPVALVGSDGWADKRLLCVKSYDETVGRLAAELLSAFAPPGGAPAVAALGHFGRLSHQDQPANLAAFRQYLAQNTPGARLTTLRDESAAGAAAQLAALLAKDPPFAIYSASARLSVAAAQAVRQAGLAGRVRVIGSDCFDESLVLLREGALTAIIDKKIPRQAFLAMRALFHHAVRGQRPESGVLYVNPEIVLRSSLEHYNREEPQL